MCCFVGLGMHYELEIQNIKKFKTINRLWLIYIGIRGENRSDLLTGPTPKPMSGPDDTFFK